jgi:type IV pilus assembly protein PilY1
MKKSVLICLSLGFLFLIPTQRLANSNECAGPPFISASASPLVMMAMERDHKLYYEAYNDAIDLDDPPDGKIDVGYQHRIEYAGFFDSYKCYTYQSTGTKQFIPSRKTSNKYCGNANEWSGNFLNYLSMSRMDLLRKVLYGGTRVTDTTSETVLEGVYIPQDAHSWGKEYAGADVRQLTPFNTPSAGKRHLFCVTSTAADTPHLIRVATDDSNHIWDWASTERAVCSGPETAGGYRHGPVGTRADIQDFVVRAKVCDTSIGLESNCVEYPGSGGTYKPTGILQKYAEGDGTKACSKSWKPCTGAADCSGSDGVCIDRSKLYIGMISGSYEKNLSGGVLRKNIWSMSDEITPATGIFAASDSVQGNIIHTIDRMKTVGFRYSDFSYEDASGGNCGWITDRALAEGECRMWGNPIGEMMYEALRYLEGKTPYTTDFRYSNAADSGLSLSKPEPWGISSDGSRLTPYSVFPECAKPFMLVISDVNTSFDSNQIPGNDTTFGPAFTGDLSNLNASTLTNVIGANESIAGGNWFIGQSGSNYDFVCSSKSVTNLSSIRGLCPEEPTKQGSYSSAAAAFYGKTLAHLDNGGKPDVSTMVVALSSPIPDINIKVGDNNVRLVPTGKSVSGCLGVYGNCFSRCTVTSDTNGIHISNCAANAYCPSNQIVDFYVENITYDANNNVTLAKFRINFEDVEQGADHDMDSIVTYTVEALGSNQIKVTLSSDYGAGCIDQVLGFVISGTTADGLYLPVKDKDVGGGDGDSPAVVAGLPLTWSKTFTASGNAAGILKDPLWYAAKYGSFADSNGNHIPDLKPEWDQDNDGTPDNYFFVRNPLDLYKKLDEAFAAIMGRVGSAGAVATVTQQVMGQDIIVRGAFTSFESDPSNFVWKGHLEAYWPYGGCASFLGDAACKDMSGCSWVTGASCVPACADTSTQGTCITKPGCEWRNGQCGATAGLVSSCSENVGQTGCDANTACTWKTTPHCTGLLYSFQKPENWSRFCYEHHEHCWEAEDLMPTPNSRSIHTLINGQQKSFSTSNICTEADWLGLNGDGEFAATDCNDLVNWVRGNDTWAKARNRDDWILGDIVYSTPVVVQAPSLASVPPDVAAASCSSDCAAGCEPITECAQKCFYCYRELQQHRKKMIYVGANDGMIHAFVAGVWWQDPSPQLDAYGNVVKDESHWIYDPNEPNSSCKNLNCTGKELVGKEQWAYIPSNLLTKLKELARPSYGTNDGCQHRFMVDLSPQAWDVYIDPDGNGPEPKQWRTILLGGQREGGDVYFAMDVTDPDNPKVLWEFPTFRNLVHIFNNGVNYQAEFPYRSKSLYDQVKGLPMTWSIPYVGQLKIPADTGFLTAEPVFPWTPGDPSPTLKVRGANDLSGWFAVIGGGPRVFNITDLPASLSLDQKLATLKSNLLMIDIEKGVNIFQYNWPLLQSLMPTRWPDQATGVGIYSPYSMGNPLVLDIWDDLGSIRNDGFLDHIYLGDLNGNVYGLKFNMDTGSTKGVEIDVWQTKPINDPTASNVFRSDTQPMTVLTSAAYDPQHNLRLFFGTGKYDNISGSSNDKTDTAKMSFYSLTDSSVRPIVEPGGAVSKLTDNPTVFNASASAKGDSSTGYTMNNFGMEIHFHCDSTAYRNSGCTWTQSDGQPDTCTDSGTPCWSCIYDFTRPGERVIDSALVAGGLVFFTTFVPTSEPCAVGGYSYLYVVDYKCGNVNPDPFRNSGFNSRLNLSQVTQGGDYAKISQGTQTVGYAAMLGPGMPSRPVLDSSGEYVFVQTSDGRIHRIKVDLPLRPMELKGWKEE